MRFVCPAYGAGLEDDEDDEADGEDVVDEEFEDDSVQGFIQHKGPPCSVWHRAVVLLVCRWMKERADVDRFRFRGRGESLQ
jgi:hypothetical protein